MGLSDISDSEKIHKLEKLLASIDLDVVILRAQPDWKLASARRILAPVTGQGGHEFLMSKVLGSLSRKTDRDITYLKIVSPGFSNREIERETRSLRELSEDQLRHQSQIQVLRHKDPAAAIAEQAEHFDLIILGAARSGDRETMIGAFTSRIARETSCPLLVLSSRDQL